MMDMFITKIKLQREKGNCVLFQREPVEGMVVII